MEKTIMVGAYSRTTGQLIDFRPARDEHGNPVYTTGPMLDEWLIMLHPDEMPGSVVIGEMVVIDEVAGQDWDGPVPVEVVVATVNGERYEPYMIVPPPLPVPDDETEVSDA